MGNIFQFRTEGFNDGERVPALLVKVGISLIKTWSEKDPVNPNWELQYFLCEDPKNRETEILRKEMHEIIFDENNNLNDMHRCAQTLFNVSEGKTENCFDYQNKEKIINTKDDETLKNFLYIYDKMNWDRKPEKWIVTGAHEQFLVFNQMRQIIKLLRKGMT